MEFKTGKIIIPFAKHTTDKQKQGEKEWINLILKEYDCEIKRGKDSVIVIPANNYNECKNRLKKILTASN